MIENLNFFIPLAFSLVVLITLILLWYSLPGHKSIFLICALLWLAVHGILAYSGFYLGIHLHEAPQRLMFVFPPIIILIILLFTKGKHFIDQLSLKTLTYLHTIRMPVE